MKVKFPAQGSKKKSRNILHKYCINPYEGQANLVWAPNWSHTETYASDVFNRLDAAVLIGKAEVVRALKRIAQQFIAGEWAKMGGDKVEANDIYDDSATGQ